MKVKKEIRQIKKERKEAEKRKRRQITINS